MSVIDQLKSHYRSGRDDLASHFFQPCMREASRYRRAVGYFSTSALLSWTDNLPRIALEDGLKIQLIASPELSDRDRETLRTLGSSEQRASYRAMVVDKILDAISSLIETPEDLGLRAEIFAWLVANDRLDLRFAFPEHIDDPGMFHEKIGIFDFPDRRTAAFTGSANETWAGHRRNYESIDVYALDHRPVLDLDIVVETGRQSCTEPVQPDPDQNSVIKVGRRIDPEHRLADQIFGDVGDQPILTDRHDHVFGRE